MTAYDRLPEAVAEVFGQEATAEEAYGLLTVDVPAGAWISALETARDKLGCTYFDWLSAVDEPGTGFRVCAHVVALSRPALDGRAVRRLLLRTTVPHEAAALPTATAVYAGAAWHERETHEMFGIDFTGHPHLVPLLLPEEFEGHPLRKDFVLASRVAKAWPGAKEPGEPEHGGPKRRTMLPPGVPDPNEWGPLKGQLPPAPARPARTPRAAGAAGAERPARTPRAADAGTERPARRMRSVSEGSASQQPEPVPTATEPPPRKRTPDAPWDKPVPATPPKTDASAAGVPPVSRSEAGSPTAVPSEPPASVEPAAGREVGTSATEPSAAAGSDAVAGAERPAAGDGTQAQPGTASQPGAGARGAEAGESADEPEAGASTERSATEDGDRVRAERPAAGEGAPAQPGADRTAQAEPPAAGDGTQAQPGSASQAGDSDSEQPAAGEPVSRPEAEELPAAGEGAPAQPGTGSPPESRKPAAGESSGDTPEGGDPA